MKNNFKKEKKEKKKFDNTHFLSSGNKTATGSCIAVSPKPCKKHLDLENETDRE